MADNMCVHPNEYKIICLCHKLRECLHCQLRGGGTIPATRLFQKLLSSTSSSPALHMKILWGPEVFRTHSCKVCRDCYLLNQFFCLFYRSCSYGCDENFEGQQFKACPGNYAYSKCPGLGYQVPGTYQRWLCLENGTFEGSRPSQELCCESSEPYTRQDPFLQVWMACPNTTAKRLPFSYIFSIFLVSHFLYIS